MKSGRAAVEATTAPNQQPVKEVDVAPTHSSRSPSKLLAEWFWTDRWIGSSAFLLPLEARGLYREMLTQAWRRGARLPNDHEAIRRAVGCTKAEWRRCWPRIEHYWRVDGAELVNDTQVDIWTKTASLMAENTERAKRAAGARWNKPGAKPEQSLSTAQVYAQAMPGQCPPSPSPSPSQNLPPPKNGGGSARATPIIARRRKDAAFEGPRVWVPQRVHDDFLALRNHPDAESELWQFYVAVSDEWTNGARKADEPGAEMFVFWRERYKERWPPAAPKSAVQSRLDAWQPKVRP